jgi:acyl carrier protein
MWFQKQIAGSFSLSPEQVTPNVSFTEDLQADSLDVVELMMELEEEFEIEIPDEDFDTIKTVGDAIRYIEQHSHAREGA